MGGSLSLTADYWILRGGSSDFYYDLKGPEEFHGALLKVVVVLGILWLIEEVPRVDGSKGS